MVTAYTDGVVTLRSNRRLDGYHEAADMSGMQGVRVGDFVVHGLDILRGSVGVSDADGAMSSVCVVCAPIADAEPRYFAWQIRAQAASGLPRALARGVREGGADFRRWDTLAELPVLCPPPDAQRAIADYLDIETTRIDALIVKKQRMIELLCERLDAAIREEVLGTGRSEGVPWAYAMGRDRVLTRLGSVLRLRQERNDPIRLRQVLSLTAARGVIPYEEKGDIGNKASEDISRYSIVRVGDIVLNSMNVIIGSVGLSQYEGVLSPVYYVLTPVDAELIDRRFLAYHFRIREFQRQLIRLGYGILDHRLRIPWVNLKSQELALPPLVEQGRVSDLLDAVEANHLILVRHLERQIDLLSEHRQALINAAVTGEIQVPRVAA
jgi:type I restriction enzyme S subunit